MKKTVLITALTILSLKTLIAQDVPNNSFEDWYVSSVSTQLEPEFYLTIDALVAMQAGVPFGDQVTQTLDAKEGLYAISIRSDTLATPFGTFPLPGLILTGDSATGAFGLPYNFRPSDLKGFYKYNALGGDTCMIAVVLTKWNEDLQVSEVIGVGQFSSNVAVAAYSPFTVSIDYDPAFDGVKPDSVQIVAASSYIEGDIFGHQVTPGATLIIDDLSFTIPTLPFFSYSPTAPLSQDVVTFTNESQGVYDSVRWDFGDGTFSIQPNPVHAYNKSGDYDASLTIFYSGGQSKALTKIITVSPKADANFIFNPSNPIINDSIQFLNNSSGTYDSLMWDFDYAGATSTDENPKYAYPAAGSYDVSLSVYSGQDTIVKTKTVVVGTVGINLEVINTIEAYPNPADRNLTIACELKNADRVTVKIYDVTGKEMFASASDMNAGLNKVEINTASFATGVYYAELEAGDYTVRNKFVVTH